MGMKFKRVEATKPVFRMNVETTERSSAYNFCTVDVNPTNNCQLSSISGFNSIAPLLKTDEDIRSYFRSLNDNVTKPLVLLDVNYRYVKRIKEAMGDRVIASRNYKSTNNSRMTILIIKIR